MVGLFDRVKASVAPNRILETLGYEGKRYAQGERFDCCPACSAHSANVFNIKNNESCHCFHCGFTGSVIDLYAAMTGKPPIEAAKELNDKYGASMDDFERKLANARQAKHSAKESSRVRQQALVKALGLLRVALNARRGREARARRYLIDARAICPSVLEIAEERSMVGYLDADPAKAQAFLIESIGKDMLINAGLMKPESNIAAIAYRPLVFFLPKAVGAEFRLIRAAATAREPKAIRYGELSYPFWWEGESAHELLIVEGAIDLLSVLSLGQKGSVIALPGCQAWRSDWVRKIHERHGTKLFVLGLDADEAGNRSARKIAQDIIEAGFDAKRIKPEGGHKDWNDSLRAAFQ